MTYKSLPIIEQKAFATSCDKLRILSAYSTAVRSNNWTRFDRPHWEPTTIRVELTSTFHKI